MGIVYEQRSTVCRQFFVHRCNPAGRTFGCSTSVFYVARTSPMRIIGGTRAGLRLTPPRALPVRPTTDMAKEALFNILQNRMDFAGMSILDLFAGTGNITFEIASRGAAKVLAVDVHFKCVQYVNATARQLKLDAI